jgi:hypothetical protein
VSTEFFPLDQEFLSREMVQQETVRMLATLELDKHKLRMQLVMSGGDAQLQSGRTVEQELERIERQLIALKSKFVDVLMPNAGA